MKNKNKADINPDIINKINDSRASENVKECLKELVEFEYVSIDDYSVRFRDTYSNSIEKWKKGTNGE